MAKIALKEPPAQHISMVKLFLERWGTSSPPHLLHNGLTEPQSTAGPCSKQHFLVVQGEIHQTPLLFLVWSVLSPQQLPAGFLSPAHAFAELLLIAYKTGYHV